MDSGSTDAYPSDTDVSSFDFRIERDPFGGNSAALVSYHGHDGTVRIPSVYRGYEVRSVYDGAFDGSDAKEVVIPGSVQSIGRHAFSQSSVEKIVLYGSFHPVGDTVLDSKCLKEVTLDCSSCLGDAVLDTGDAKVHVFCGIRIPDGLRISNGEIEVQLSQGSISKSQGRYMDISFGTYDKTGLSVDILRQVGFSDCYRVVTSGLSDLGAEIRFVEPEYNYNTLTHKVYVLEEGSLVDMGTFGAKEMPAFHIDGQETVFFYSVSSERVIDDSPTLGICIAIAGTVLGMIYLLIHRRD